MELQHTFSKKYADRLELEATKNIQVERYSLKEFPYDAEQVFIIPTIEKPEGLRESLLQTVTDDFKSATKIYEAYSKITPVQASDRSFWTYLAHVDLFEYVQRRFPKVLEKDFNDGDFINKHWFYGLGHPIYHPLYGLWWDIHQTIDPTEKNDPYHYSKFLFKDYNLRTTFMGRYMMFRHREEVLGILQFLMDEEELSSEHFRQRFRYISQYFNRLGATKQLISLDRNYFYDKLQSIKSDILKIETDEDVKRH